MLEPTSYETDYNSSNYFEIVAVFVKQILNFLFTILRHLYISLYKVKLKNDKRFMKVLNMTECI